MWKIFKHATTVLIWLGPDTMQQQAEVAIDSILTISDFLCRKLGVQVPQSGSTSQTYQELVLKNRDILPLPNECEFSTDTTWKALIWFYSHPYFSQTWVIQEIGANKKRLVQCGREKIDWDRVDLVASYIIMEPAFSVSFGFSSTYCWWAASVTELVQQQKNWLAMLYLSSNFSCLDARDAIYSLRGLMEFSDGAGILDPDYSKSIVEVYRDSVEAALVNFENTNALLYITGDEAPSWIPRWDRPMLFRNPFRFGKAVPWKPAGESKPKWDIDKKSNVLTLSGFVVDPIKLVEPYNESLFGNGMTRSDEGRNSSKQAWLRILKTMEINQSQTPLNIGILTAAAKSFSFGLDEKNNPADEHHLLRNFVAYLKILLDEETYDKYIPPDVSKNCEQADGLAFGKPVWDFEYPESSFFITEGSLIGCSVSTTRPGDVVCVALGSTYPFVLRPDGDNFLIRGYAYVEGIMHREQRNAGSQDFKIL